MAANRAVSAALHAPQIHCKYQYTQAESTVVTEKLHINSLFSIKRPKVIASIVTKKFQSI